MSEGLPVVVTALLDERLEGRPRGPLRDAAERARAVYREGGASAIAVRDGLDALAYALARMPATYAAVRRALDELAVSCPGLAPVTLTDIGCGTGSGFLAARTRWPSLAEAHLIEPSAALGALACDVAAAIGLPVTLHAEKAVRIPSADLMLAAYVLVEQDETTARAIVERAVSAARTAVVVVEPGTQRGFERIRLARDVLVAHGWHLAAPCPHEAACPMAGGDWCHFKIRLPRSRAHRQLKSAELAFEDEPFSYVAAVREPPVERPADRVLRSPQVHKGSVDLTVCAATGIARRAIPRRDAAAYKAARRLMAGDRWPPAAR